MRTDEEQYKTNEEACALILEMEAAMQQYGVSIEVLYDIAADESRKDGFVRMFKLLQEYTA